MRFYLFDDASFDGDDLLIGESTGKAIKVNKSGKGKLKAELPDTNPYGRFLIAVIDATNDVSECDEDNNVAVFGPLPQPMGCSPLSISRSKRDGGITPIFGAALAGNICWYSPTP